MNDVDTPMNSTSSLQDSGGDRDYEAMQNPQNSQTSENSQFSLPMILEGILMCAPDPVQVEDLANILDYDETLITITLEELSQSYESRHRGFRLQYSARGWSFVSAPELDTIISQFLKKGSISRLSQASLEVLAIIAYKQPITRAGIAAIRGVSSDSSVRSLLMQGLVEEIDSEEGFARSLITTDLFLEKMDITSLGQLPPLAPLLPKVEQISILEEQIRQSEEQVS